MTRWFFLFTLALAATAKPDTTSPSHYLGRLHDDGFAAAETRPMFVGARPPDREPLACRGRLRVRKDPAAYVAGLGQPGLLAKRWDEVVALAARPADETFFHVFVMHYPRPALPGRCVTLHVTFSNVRDPAFHAKRAPAPRRGLLFSVRATYRLDGDAPRLIEAAVEAHDARAGRALVPAGHLLHDTLGDVARDDEAMAHYTDLGGGRRVGYAWTEKGAVAYEIEGAAVKTKPLDAAQIRSLLAFARRA